MLEPSLPGAPRRTSSARFRGLGASIRSPAVSAPAWSNVCSTTSTPASRFGQRCPKRSTVDASSTIQRRAPFAPRPSRRPRVPWPEPHLEALSSWRARACSKEPFLLAAIASTPTNARATTASRAHVGTLAVWGAAPIHPTSAQTAPIPLPVFPTTTARLAKRPRPTVRPREPASGSRGLAIAAGRSCASADSPVTRERAPVRCPSRTGSPVGPTVLDATIKEASATARPASVSRRACRVQVVSFRHRPPRAACSMPTVRGLPRIPALASAFRALAWASPVPLLLRRSIVRARTEFASIRPRHPARSKLLCDEAQ